MHDNTTIEVLIHRTVVAVYRKTFNPPIATLLEEAGQEEQWN